jgi:tellurite resistance-related uncharacterized protein
MKVGLPAVFCDMLLLPGDSVEFINSSPRLDSTKSLADTGRTSVNPPAGLNTSDNFTNMKSLPDNARSYKSTPEFTDQTVPGGLLGRHSTAQGVWGIIHITEGRLLYRILEPETSEYLLDPGQPGVVEPEIPHQVEIIGPVRFYVEFHRLPGS